jgi:hypothetical protein
MPAEEKLLLSKVLSVGYKGGQYRTTEHKLNIKSIYLDVAEIGFTKLKTPTVVAGVAYSYNVTVYWNRDLYSTVSKLCSDLPIICIVYFLL